MLGPLVFPYYSDVILKKGGADSGRCFYFLRPRFRCMHTAASVAVHSYILPVLSYCHAGIKCGPGKVFYYLFQSMFGMKSTCWAAAPIGEVRV